MLKTKSDGPNVLIIRARQMRHVSDIGKRHEREIDIIQLSFSKKDFFDFLEVVWTEAERHATKSLRELSSSKKTARTLRLFFVA